MGCAISSAVYIFLPPGRGSAKRGEQFTTREKRVLHVPSYRGSEREGIPMCNHVSVFPEKEKLLRGRYYVEFATAIAVQNARQIVNF